MKEKTIKLKGYGVFWKKEIRPLYDIKELDIESFMLNAEFENLYGKVTNIDYPIFSTRKDAIKFINKNKDWEVREVLFEFRD